MGYLNAQTARDLTVIPCRVLSRMRESSCLSFTGLQITIKSPTTNLVVPMLTNLLCASNAHCRRAPIRSRTLSWRASNKVRNALIFISRYIVHRSIVEGENGLISSPTTFVKAHRGSLLVMNCKAIRVVPSECFQPSIRFFIHNWRHYINNWSPFTRSEF